MVTLRQVVTLTAAILAAGCTNTAHNVAPKAMTADHIHVHPAGGTKAAIFFAGQCRDGSDVNPAGEPIAPRRWYQVDRLVDSQRTYKGEGLHPVAFESNDTVIDEYTMHQPLTPAVRWALDHGGTVAFSTSDDYYFGTRHVNFIVATTKSGKVYLPGLCYYSRYQQHLQELWGTDYSNVVLDAVGTTGTDFDARIFDWGEYRP